MQILPVCGSVTDWSEWEACNSCWPMQRLCKRTETGLVNLQCKQSTFGAVRKKEKEDRKTDERILGKVNLPGWRKAEKKEQRSVKFQKRTIPASPWRNAGRMGITFAAFEALLSPSTTAGTAHLTARWPALKEEMQGRWMPAWSFQT